MEAFSKTEESVTGKSKVTNVKNVQSVFSTRTAFALREYGPTGQIINQAYYLKVLRHLGDVEL